MKDTPVTLLLALLYSPLESKAKSFNCVIQFDPLILVLDLCPKEVIKRLLKWFKW
jgi:hypothetical protein